MRFLPLTLLALLPLYAEETTSAPPERSIYQTILIFVLMGAIFYLLLFRPEAKRRKAIEKIRGEMKKGDKVVASGIIGTVDKIEGETVILRMFDGNKIKVLKGAISEVIPEAQVAVQIEKEVNVEKAVK